MNITGRCTHAWTVGEDFKLDSLENCEGFNLRETESLVDLRESDHILHHHTWI